MNPLNSFRLNKKDIMASFVVFLVALPLCLGIAVASGLTPEKGLISGAIGGIIVGILGGAPLQVSGPANGLIVVVSQAVLEYGLHTLSLAIFLAGCIQLFAGWARVGQFFRAVSPGVILGLMAGFAVIIFASQSYVIIDYKPTGSTLQNLIQLPMVSWEQFFGSNSERVQMNVGLGVLTLFAIIGWNRWAPKKLKAIPAYLIAVGLVTALSFYLPSAVSRVAVPDNVGGVLMSGLSEGVFGWHFGMLHFGLFELALVIALIASAETLLSATATDQLHNGPRTKYNQELCAQGIGNILCGLICAPPITGVIIRSTANVSAGATTRLSTIMHGVWLLLLVILGASVLNQIPLVALAAVLIHAVTRLVKVNSILELRQYDGFGPVIFAVTLLSVISLGALWGVMIGMGLAILRLVHKVAALQVKVQPKTDVQNGFQFSLVGPASFIRVPVIAEALESIPRKASVEFDLGKTVYIDQACAELLRSWVTQHRAAGGEAKLDEQKMTQLTLPAWMRAVPSDLQTSKPRYLESVPSN